MLALPSLLNSTNVRKVEEGAFLLGLKVGAAVAPAWTADRAIDRFLRTSRRPPSEAAASFRASGEVTTAEVEGRRVVARSWGVGRPVLLLHGWNGGVTDFRHVVPGLVAAGYRAVAIDAPGHGESEGDEANAVLLGRSLAAVAAGLGPVRAVVAHSLGGASAAWAVAEGLVSTERLVLLAPAAEPGWYVERAAGALGTAFATRLVRTLEARVGVPVADLRLASSAPRIEAPVLVVHDAEDRETPLKPVLAAVAGVPGVRLLRTNGLGHRKILADAAVVGAVVEAVAGEGPEACGHEHLPGACARCGLEGELFHRDDR